MIRFKTRSGICVLCALLASAPAFARQMSLDEAIRNVSGRLNAKSIRPTQKLIYTGTYADLNVAYVLQSDADRGFVVLAADDLLPAVLGYSDSGSLDAASLAPAMEYWLQEYGRQLRYAVDNGLSAAPRTPRATRQPIAPLCKATWGQSRPFNDNCPEYDSKHTPAGCTATAMAQVMYVHQWPVSGTGKNSYISGELRLNLSFDYGATTFDWSNMLPSYSSAYNAAQGAAVATLLEACGNSALMDYGQNASGAYPYNGIYGMVKFMKYDKGALYLQRDFYSSERWDEMVYNELANKRPVLYGGYTADYTAGHTFVVDGYSSDGFYHINWGWSGLSNGYFLLTGLDPADQGIGGSSSGYNYRQDAVIYIAPAAENSDYRLEVMLDDNFTTSAKNYPKNGTIEFVTGKDTSYTGFTLAESAKATMGVNLTPVDGGETVFYPGSEIEFKSYYGMSARRHSSFTVPVSDLPASGEFIATPAYKYNGQVQEVAVKTGMQKSLRMAFARMGVSIQDIAVSRTLTADNIKALTPLYSGKTCNVSAQISNSGDEYHAMVKAGFANNEGTVLAWLDNVPVSIPDGKTLEATFTGKLVRMTDGQPLAAGDYDLGIYDEDNNLLGSPLGVVVTEAPSGAPVYDMKIKVSGAESGEGTGVSPYLVGDQVTAEITVSVTSGLFDDIVALYAYYDDNNDDVDFSGENSNRKTFFVGPGRTQTNDYILGTANFELNRTVYVNLYGWDSTMSGPGQGWLPQKLYFKRVTSGVSDVEAARSGIFPNPAVSTATVTAKARIEAIDVYTVTGSRVMSVAGNGTEAAEVNVSALRPGLYIVTATTAAGTETFRLIKR